VITVDTSVAHLAGAMGKPVWILVPPQADWRWILGRNDSPWYPTARIYRRMPESSWDSVVAQVASDLRRLHASVRDQSPDRRISERRRRGTRAAVILHNNGRLDDASAIYSGILQIDPGQFRRQPPARARHGAAKDATKKRRPCFAMRYGFVPRNVSALSNLIRLLRNTDKHEEALEAHNQLVALRPSDPKVWSERSVSLIALKRHDEALDSVNRALALDPNHLNALNNYAVVMLHQKRPGEALAYLDRLLAIKPDFWRESPIGALPCWNWAGRSRPSKITSSESSSRQTRPRNCATTASP
jgi:tetratricopeptide (TPR) repeat protein